MRTENKPSVCESIMERIRRDIALGILRKGDRIPSCRELALDMGVNPNTVQRAYSLLEEEGVLYTIPKKGVYIKDGAQDAKKAAEEQLRALKAAGMKREELLSLIEKIYTEEHS